MIDAVDRGFLERARQLAALGLGRAEPNPLVGCVVVKNGAIIGEGFHRCVGTAHAEPNALDDCRARGNNPRGATMYVTLEPCCHTGKLTPPCVPRVIDAGISRVVIGAIDPNPEVNSKGVEQLKAARIEVDLPDDVQTQRYRQLIAPYFARLHHRPYVTMKWAETADGYVANENRVPLAISNQPARRFLHKLRARSDAIAVGIGTVLADDPRLDARDVDVVRASKTVVFDRNARMPFNARLFLDGQRDVLIFTTKPFESSTRFPARCSVHQIDDVDFLAHAIEILGQVSPPMTHLIVEAGPTLARAFFQSNQCDRLLVNRSKTRLNNPNAIRAGSIPGHFKQTASIDFAGDEYVELLNTRSEVFFDLSPSPDFTT